MHAERNNTPHKNAHKAQTDFYSRSHYSLAPLIDRPAKERATCSARHISRVLPAGPPPTPPTRPPPTRTYTPRPTTPSTSSPKPSYLRLLALAKPAVAASRLVRLTRRIYIPSEPGTMASSSSTSPRQPSQTAPLKREPVSRSTTPRPLNLPQATNDHTLSSFRHRLSQREYPADCPPLNVRWFYAVDVGVDHPSESSRYPAGRAKKL